MMQVKTHDESLDRQTLQANLFAATDHHITRRYIIILEMTV